MHRRSFILCAAGIAFVGRAANAGGDEKPGAAGPDPACPKKRREKTVMVRLQTSLGSVALELDEAKAPVTVANFVQYVNTGFYSNTLFHRVINGFMIQGGGFEPGMKQKPTSAPIQNEAANGLKNEAYTIAMARTSDPQSATSQFFINVADNAFLDYKASTPQGFGYCVFGKVVEGKDVIDKIKSVKTAPKGGHQDVPVEDVIIERAELC
jgi:peptidyl-prolyl cis-trans isomerase B (cyclophilin B)